MKDYSQPKEFEEEQFLMYPIYSGENIDIIKDDFENIMINTISPVNTTPIIHGKIYRKCNWHFNR